MRGTGENQLKRAEEILAGREKLFGAPKKEEEKEEEGLKPLFVEPVGESEIYLEDLGLIMTDCEVKCEICGTLHNKGYKRDVGGGSALNYFYFLGRRGIWQCCSKVLDEVFRENTDLFAILLTKFIWENPTSEESLNLINILEGGLGQIKEKLEKSKKCADGALSVAKEVTEMVKNE